MDNPIGSLIGFGIIIYIVFNLIIALAELMGANPHYIVIILTGLYFFIGYRESDKFRYHKKTFYYFAILLALVINWATFSAHDSIMLKAILVIEGVLVISYVSMKKYKTSARISFNEKHSQTILDNIIKAEVQSVMPEIMSYSKTDFRGIHSLLLDEIPKDYLKPENNSEFTIKAENFLKKIEPLNINYTNKHFNSAVSIMFGQLKGASGEKLAIDKIKGTGKKFISNAVIKSSEGQAEIDAIVFGKNKIYTFECKDYSAKEIVLNSSGYLYKIKNNDEEERIEVLSQVERHNRIIKSAFGQEVQIINTIIITDRNTKVTSQLNNDYLKLYHVDMLSFFVSQIEQGGDELMEMYEVVKGIEKSFPLPDLDLIEEKIKEAVAEEIENISTFVRAFPNTENIFVGLSEKIIHSLNNDKSKLWLKAYDIEKIQSYIDKEISYKKAHLDKSIAFRDELLSKKRSLETITNPFNKITPEFLERCHASAEKLSANNAHWHKINALD